MSERAKKLLAWLQQQIASEFPIRQQTLAELFGCSRRSIGRALKELKEAALLVDLNKRHENRCKVYQIKIPPAPLLQRGQETGLTPEAQLQWEHYGKTFKLVFKMPNLELFYAQVTWELDGIKDESELYSKTFAGLWKISEYKEAIC